MKVFDKFYFSDEAWFHLSGYINSQNFRTWSTENPHTFTETSLHPKKIGVWCAISRTKIIGPIFFENTINAERYADILYDYIALLPRDERDAYFQQDGARAHTAGVTHSLLGPFFGKRLISLGSVSGIIWPPRSPDLTPPDFFLWSHLKNRVFRTQPASIEELKNRITEEIQQIDQKMLRNVFKNLKKRAQLCKDANGGHFQQLL